MNRKRNSRTGLVTQIKTLETHDGPGLRTTIFLKGCPLRCTWCSNPETQRPYPELYFIARRCKACQKCTEVCPVGAIRTETDRKIDREKCNLCWQCIEICPNSALEKVGAEVTPEEIIEKVAKDKPFYDRSGGGVTLSGGEPLSQPKFTLELLQLAREQGIHTCLDTSGYGRSEDVKEIIGRVNLVLLDIKHMDPVKHRKWTGVSNELILKNAKIIAARCPVRISIPLIPGVNDDDPNIEQTIAFALSLGVQDIDLLPFHRLGTTKYQFLGLVSPYASFEKLSEERVAEVAKKIESSGIRASVERSM